MSKKERMVVVHRGTELEAQVIKGLLESYGIPCLLQQEAAGRVYGITVDGLGEARVMVWESAADEARRLIDDRGEAAEETGS